jgi:hypothetical protein
MSDVLFYVNPVIPRCRHCDDTGDVHDQTGEWRGRCTCPAGRALLPWTPTDLAAGRAPCDGNAWVDVKLRTGAIHYRARAYTWAWGEAGDGTITYWRMAR